MRVSVEVAHKVHDLIEGVRFPHHASRIMAYSYSGYYARLSIGSQEFDSPISRQISCLNCKPKLVDWSLDRAQFNKINASVV